MFAIVVSEKGGEQKRLEFDKPEVTIGRVQGNDIILPKGNVSKRHSRIVLKDGKFIIVDLKSTNGTYVNGRKITSPLVVKGSDKIYIGDFILSIEAEGAAAGTDDGDAPPPPPRRPTAPPPPPRRGDDAHAEEGHTGDGSDEEDDIPPPPPPRPTRPSLPSLPQQAAAPAPLPPPDPPAPVVTSPPLARTLGPTPAPTPPPPRMTAPREAVRPPAPSRPDMPVVPPAEPPRARPSVPSMPVTPAAPPVARPAPQPVAPPVAAVAARPSRAPARSPVDEAVRGRLADCIRELSGKLAEALDLGHAHIDEETWSRAENVASDLIDKKSADGGLPGGVDSETLLRDVVAETLGLGPLEDLVNDEAVRDVIVSGPDRVFIGRDGHRDLSPRLFSSAEAVDKVLTRLLRRATSVVTQDAVVEARLAGGMLLTAVLPPQVSNGPVLRLRRPRIAGAHLGDLVAQGALTQGQSDYLEAALKARKNILISGPAGSGRTTVMSALCRALPPGERVVTVEESDELGLREGCVVTVLGRGPGLRAAFSAALRLMPERLVIGDLRGAETVDLLAALNGGLDGVMATVQLGAPRELTGRLETLARHASEAPPVEVLRDEIGRGFQVYVHLGGGADIRVTELGEIQPGAQGPTLRPARV